MIKEHRIRSQMKERIAKFPIVRQKSLLPSVPSKSISTRFDAKEYMNSVRHYESCSKLIDNIKSI